MMELLFNEGGPVICDFFNSKVKVEIDNYLDEMKPIYRIIATVIDFIFLKKKLPPPIFILLEGLQGIVNIGILGNSYKLRKRIIDLLPVFMKNYGSVARHNSYFIANIYKSNLLTDSTLGYNSRITKKSKVKKINKNSRKSNDNLNKLVQERSEYIDDKKFKNRIQPIFSLVSKHYYGGIFFNINNNFELSIIHGMELHYAHYWGTYGIPIYISENINNKKVIYNITNNIYSRLRENRKYNIYDMPEENIKNFIGKNFSKNIKAFLQEIDNANIINNEKLGIHEKYSHFIKKIPETEDCQYEDLEKHLEYIEAATLKFPLSFLPFFHFDPRRYFSPVEKVINYHNFFILNNNILEKMPREWILNIFNEKERYEENNINNITTIEKKLESGLYFGVKMYSALGCSPYISNNKEAKKIYNCLENDDYIKLLDFYDFCARKNIPITCHGSPQGMTIADTGVYFKKFLKKNPNNNYKKINNPNFKVNGKSFMYGTGLIDSFSSPMSWRTVFESLEKKKKLIPTLCLAHFGGSRFFNGTFKEKTPYQWWVNEISKLIKEYDSVYVDLSCFTFKDFKPFPDEIPEDIYNKMNNMVDEKVLGYIYSIKKNRNSYKFNKDNFEKILFYKGYDEEYNVIDNELIFGISDLRLFLISEIKKEGHDGNNINDFYDWGECYRELYITADTLRKIINNNKKLRHRILYGTDWPMTEMSVKGLSHYNGAMFVLMQMLTIFLGNTWDAWHQFAVINPLRFLGLLDNPNDTEEIYYINSNKIENLKESITNYLSFIDEDEYIKKYEIDILDSLDNLDKSYSKFVKNFENGIIDGDEGFLAFPYYARYINNRLKNFFIVYNFKTDQILGEYGNSDDDMRIRYRIDSNNLLTVVRKNPLPLQVFVLNWRTGIRTNNELTEKLMETSLRVFHSFSSEKKILFGAIGPVTNSINIKATWKDNFSDVQITPINYLVTENGKWLSTMYLSPNGQWATTFVGGYRGLNQENLHKRAFFHIDNRYPNGISMPVFTEGYRRIHYDWGSFVNHPVHGQCFAEEHINNERGTRTQCLRLYKMSDVLAEINRQIFEKANQIRR